MGWNDNMVVLSFRGTASFRNVLADIKVRRCFGDFSAFTERLLRHSINRHSPGCKFAQLHCCGA